MITEIYEDFTSVWCLFHHVSREKALRQINGGACGVAAYATSEVLKARGFNVKHYSNCWHVWNRIDGVDYDTYRPEGYDVPVYLAWGAPMDGEVPDVDVYMWNNVLEALLVKAFLKRHNVPVPDLVHELIARKPPIARRTLKGWKMVEVPTCPATICITAISRPVVTDHCPCPSSHYIWRSRRLKREINDVVDPGRCCPGHDTYPADTYSSKRSIHARSRDIKKEHRHVRRVKKHRLRNTPGEIIAGSDLEGRIQRFGDASQTVDRRSFEDSENS